LRNSPRRTSITDFVVEALIPVFIIGLIWSLVAFAIALKGVFYPGQEQTLSWVFFLYVMGTVMTNRLAGLYGESEKAKLYSIALVSVMALFALTFCAHFGSMAGGTAAGEGFLANLTIVAVVGFASYKLCRESCFDIMPAAPEKSDIQLRAEIRAQQDWYRRERHLEDQEKKNLEAEKNEAKMVTSPQIGSVPIFARHPGIWTIYFSLFSLVVFSIGQRLLPADNWQLYSRAYAYMLENLVCALALLLLTTLSALRFRCWEKKTDAPSGIGWFWTLAGGASILLVVSLTSLLPRPVPKYLVRSASSALELAATGKEPEGEMKGISGKTWGGQTFQIETALEKEERDAKKMAKEMSGQNDEKKGEEEAGKGKGKDSEDDSGSASSQGRSSQAKSGSSQGGSSDGSRRTSTQPAYTATAKRAPLPTPPLHGLETLGRIVFAILLVLGLLFGLGRLLVSLGRSNPFSRASNRLKELAARLRNLFKARRKRWISVKEIEETLKQENLYLENPFTSSQLLKSMSKGELVSYTYMAFENYAHAQGHTPSSGQTPAEFVKSLPENLQAPEFHTLLKMFLLAEYSTHEVPDESMKSLKQVWAKIGG
jgi:ABC-type multidrug transport system fused ATPase/permease subunit